MHIKTKSIKDKGFTIVELLVVIVVIGILAAITIVSYGGVTVRANSSASQNAANAVNKKSNVYATEATTTGKYPATLATLFTPTTSTYFLSGVTYDAMGTVTTNSAIPPASPTAPASKSSILYAICGVRTAGTNTAPTQASEIITVTGNKIYYWDWSTSAITTTPTTNGILSGTVGPQTVGCFPAGS